MNGAIFVGATVALLGIAIVVHPVWLSSVAHTALSTPSILFLGGVPAACERS